MHFAEKTHPLHVLTILQVRDFRIFWSGLATQVMGQMMLTFTLGWLAFHLTGSPLAIGYVALFQAIPTIALTLLGGVIADRGDQRHHVEGRSAVQRWRDNPFRRHAVAVRNRAVHRSGT